MSIFRKLNDISIVYKLSGIISLLVLVSMLFVGIFTYSSNKSAIIDRTYEQLTSVRFEKTRRLQSFLSNKILEVTQFASKGKTQDYLTCISDIEKEGLPALNSELTKISEDYFIRQGHVHRLLIFSDNNFVVIDLNDSVENVYNLIFTDLQEVLNSHKSSDFPLVTDIMKNDRDETVFYIFTTVECSEKNVLLGFEISSNEISDILLEDNPFNGLGASGEVYLVGPDALMRSKSRFLPESVLKISVPNPLIAEINSNPSGKNLVNDYRGIRVLSSYSTFDWGNVKWMIFAEIDYEEALVPVYAFRDSIIFLGFLGALLFSAVIMLLTVTITRPVAKLKSAAVEISKGNFKIDLPVSNQDEIGRLSSTFNQMAGQIEEQNRRLEEQKMNRLQEMIDWQENERRRLSRELHDGIGQMLLSAKFRLGRISGSTNKDDTLIEETNGIIQQAVRDVRNISNDLMPAVLSEFGLVLGIKNICEQIGADYKMEVRFYTNIESLPKDKLSTYLYRIVQEAFSNIIRHAQANAVKIQLMDTGKFVELVISDDGKGFDDKNISDLRGNGLRNISERVNLLNGKCSISSPEGKGTIITISIPKISVK